MPIQKSVQSISSEVLEDLFTTYFDEKIAPYADIDTYDVTCTKDSQTNKAIITVQIYGTAGAPTVDDFKLDRVKFKGIKNITVERSDIGSVEFELKNEKTVIVNSNDYMITYESK